MLKRVLVAAAMLCAAIPAAIAGDTETWAVVRGWTIGVDTTIGNGCFIYAPFEDGLHFRLGFNPDANNAYVVFGNPSWQSLEAGESYPVKMQMGRKSKWNGNATGSWLDGIPSLVVSSADEDFIIEIASQTTLKAWFRSNQIANISLKGTMAAIQEMIDCQQAMNTLSGSGDDPFAD